MSYCLYLPGVAGGIDQLAKRGLADLARDRSPDFAQMKRGPDGGPGTLCAWRIGKHKKLSALARSQEWLPCRADPRSGLARGDYWLAIDNKRRPQPADLERNEQQPGYWITLADGAAWRVPAASSPPTDDGRRELAGNEAASANYWEHSRACAASLLDGCAALQLARRLQGERAATVSNVGLPLRDVFHLAVEALAINYRVNAEIVTRLGLLNDEALRRVVLAIVDVPALLKADSERAKSLCLHPRWTSHLLWRKGLAPAHRPTWADIYWLTFDV